MALPHVELSKLLEDTILSLPDGFTKTRHPQYKPANESAAQRGRLAEPAPAGPIPTPSIAAPEREDGWDMVGSNESTVDGNGSGSGCTATHDRPSTSNGDAKVEPIDESHQLTASNVRLLDMQNNQLSFHERIMLRDSQAKHSIVVKSTLTRVSESTIDLGEGYSPASAHSPEPDICGVGAWADAPMPPMV